MHPTIAQHRSGISAICQRYRISRLEVFGSAARADDLNLASSDADAARDPRAAWTFRKSWRFATS